MACSFLTRLFHRRRSTASTASTATPAAANPAASSAATSSLLINLGIRSLRPLSPLLVPTVPTLPTDFTSDTVTALAGPFDDSQQMAQPGFASLIISNPGLLPHLTLADVTRAFQDLEGYVDITTDTENVGEDLCIRQCIISFRNSSEAARALAAHPELITNGQTFSVNPFSHNNMDSAGIDNPADDESEQPQQLVGSQPDARRRPRKRLRKDPPKPPKPQCKVCYVELDGPYSTPCRKCNSPRCYDCLKTEFKVALTDLERMPVTCCAMVVHHDVANKILSMEEIDTYKLKFDENNTPNPLYCPVPRCSTFLPPRLIAKGATKVICPTCLAMVCTICKEQAGKNHACGKGGQREIILDKFHYKICPKCGTGVMKMYGCPHVRCQCGAHWCWDCRRPINACYRKPCRVAREDGQESEPDANDSESEDEPDTSVPDQMVQAEQPMATTETDNVTFEESAPVTENIVVPEMVAETNTAEATQIPSTLAERTIQQQVIGEGPTEDQAAANTDAAATELENLDDPDAQDWENHSDDFGEEPSDESWDIWGCRHQFRDFEKQHIPDFWLVGVDPKQLGDLEVGCLSCFEGAKVWETKQPTETAEETTEGTKDDKEDSEPKSSPKQNLLEKKVNKSKCAFECLYCGVVYCGGCKKTAVKRMRDERTAMDVDE
ncbi:uncharacterized protein A1O9_06413 [Exophiala aquamarina CBS 119918]|uniref:RBR-type E3 ubiquitin transferase n=1 Tax=Exophiala aquamarina CBS 119918 TaxID=1182545 RepID=A0A072PFD8_9EURO|nr:uncharacterized protein A1O9_06413 [Exophiala aquamarina CBS 119918]KEF58487.1 hypothetical protein A1O9_06413 [Exophiala aquamarina CBS 119918]